MVIKKQKLDHESYEREEKAVFHGREPEVLKCIHTLSCFTNYKGGKYFVKEVKNPKFLKSFFDAAVLENKLNSYLDPSVSGIIGVSSYNKKGVKIIIKKSNRGPHFYKEDGYFINFKKEKVFVFKRGSIGIRRSGLNDIFNSKDLEALFKNKLSELFKGVQEVVVKQPIGELFNTIGKLKGISSEIVAYKHSPKDPEAVPMRQILDTEPFNNINEELNASVKSWKTSKAMPSEVLIANAYKNSKNIKNKEHLNLLLLSSLEKHLPPYLWASKIKSPELKSLIKEIINKDCYPSTNEALKLIVVLSSRFVAEILSLADSSKYISVNHLATKISNLNLKDKNRIESIRKFLLGTTNYNGKINIDTTINDFIEANREKKSESKYLWRIYDLENFGWRLSK